MRLAMIASGDGANRHDTLIGIPGHPANPDNGPHRSSTKTAAVISASDAVTRRQCARACARSDRRHHRGDQMPGVRAGDVDAVRIRRGADVFERELERNGNDLAGKLKLVGARGGARR